MRVYHLLLVSPFLEPVLCRHNITVDAQNSSIIYNPKASWIQSANSSLDAGGSHMLTQDPKATATFTFTGVAIYYMSPLWPYIVNSAVSLDSGPISLLDLVDHSRPNVGQGSETVQAQVIWGVSGLPNTQHTLVVSVGAGQSFAIVDALLYTVLDPGDLATSASMTSALSSSSAHATSSSSARALSSSSIQAGSKPSTAASVTTTNASKSSSHVVPIALGTIFGLLALLLILVGIWFCLRRRRRPTSEAWSVPGNPYPGSPLVPPPMSNLPGHAVYDYAYSGVDQPYYGNNWGAGSSSGPIPGAMSPATAAAMANPYYAASVGDGWQGTTSQIAQRYMRLPHRPKSLSTISETPTPRETPLPHSPSPNAAESGNRMI